MTKIERLIEQLQDSSSSEALAISEILEGCDGDKRLGIEVLESFQDWAKKAKAVLKGQRKEL